MIERSPAIDELIKRSFADDADWWFRLLVFSTIALFVGVVLEEIPLLDLLETHVIDMQTGQFVRRKWVLLIRGVYKWLFLVLIVGGIGGEGIAEYIASRYEGLLRDFSGTLLTTTQLQASLASERASANEKEVARLGLDLQTEKTKSRNAQTTLTNAQRKAEL